MRLDTAIPKGRGHTEMSHREKRLHKAQTFYNDPENEFKEAVVNAAILAGLAFFETLAGMAIAGIMTDPVRTLIAAGIAAGLAFFTRLAYERGIKKEEG